MLSAFFEWTTHLNRTDPWAFALVTVLTMATVGGAIALIAEGVLSKLSGGKSAAADPSAGH